MSGALVIPDAANAAIRDASPLPLPTHRRLKRDNVKAFARRFRAQRDAYHAGEMTLDEIRESLRAWIAHAEHGNSYRLRQSLFKQVIF